jgi:light-regulated signal transduction histidine kinase (bacteriophytochrome)
MLTGKSAYEIIGRNIWDVQYDLIPESDRNPKRHDQLKSTLQKTLKSGKASYLNIPIEQNYLRNDGKNLILSAKINSVKTEKGYLLVSVTRDITEQRVAEEKIKILNEELEQKVIERTAQLEFLNKELESFSYTVSHDLRAPLRSIAGFSQILQDEYSGIMDEQGRTYLNRLTDGAKLMSNLINDLLNLSRITRTKKNVSEINLSAIIQSFANEYQNNDTKRKANFIIQPDLYILADLALMRILVQNLMENAWKFTSKKPKAIIEFGQLEINEEKVFFIRDNGSGFDMKYANKLFIPFNRLHTSDEFEGTGIGLATVHRIISRHNGKIWAESEIDKGTTFYFTISS